MRSTTPHKAILSNFQRIFDLFLSFLYHFYLIPKPFQRDLTPSCWVWPGMPLTKRCCIWLQLGQCIEVSFEWASEILGWL